MAASRSPSILRITELSLDDIDMTKVKISLFDGRNR